MNDVDDIYKSMSEDALSLLEESFSRLSSHSFPLDNDKKNDKDNEFSSATPNETNTLYHSAQAHAKNEKDALHNDNIPKEEKTMESSHDIHPDINRVNSMQTFLESELNLHVEHLPFAFQGYPFQKQQQQEQQSLLQKNDNNMSVPFTARLVLNVTDKNMNPPQQHSDNDNIHSNTFHDDVSQTNTTNNNSSPQRNDTHTTEKESKSYPSETFKNSSTHNDSKELHEQFKAASSTPSKSPPSSPPSSPPPRQINSEHPNPFSPSPLFSPTSTISSMTSRTMGGLLTHEERILLLNALRPSMLQNSNLPQTFSSSSQPQPQPQPQKLQQHDPEPLLQDIIENTATTNTNANTNAKEFVSKNIQTNDCDTVSVSMSSLKQLEQLLKQESQLRRALTEQEEQYQIQSKTLQSTLHQLDQEKQKQTQILETQMDNYDKIIKIQSLTQEATNNLHKDIRNYIQKHTNSPTEQQQQQQQAQIQQQAKVIQEYGVGIMNGDNDDDAVPEEEWLKGLQGLEHFHRHVAFQKQLKTVELCLKEVGENQLENGE